jgi:hypothetical protein
MLLQMPLIKPGSKPESSEVAEGLVILSGRALYLILEPFHETRRKKT